MRLGYLALYLLPPKELFQPGKQLTLTPNREPGGSLYPLFHLIKVENPLSVLQLARLVEALIVDPMLEGAKRHSKGLS